MTFTGPGRSIARTPSTKRWSFGEAQIVGLGNIPVKGTIIKTLEAKAGDRINLVPESAKGNSD